eukprot:TRINITY_DN56618_c0_g1_i1.p1 TRINITY_DN56618_c0_g1~~TRINITY_DN56618_c0_g1_i1.p1  ORF type:complete len:318 (+),score=90.71 TRINITY_DN56618_c0_g1_i1:51-956(+)
MVSISRLSSLALIGVLSFSSWHCRANEEHAEEHGDGIEPDLGEIDPSMMDGDEMSPDESDLSFMTPEKLEKLHAMIDTDKNGKVSLKETHEYSKKYKKTSAQGDIQHMLSEVDSDKDGKVTMQELIADAQAEAGDNEEEKAGLEERYRRDKEKFQAADADSDNYLAGDELIHYFYPEMHEDVAKVMSKFTMEDRDTNKDGELTLKEFWGEEDSKESDFSEEEKRDFHRLDKDGNGKLNLAELMTWETGEFHNVMSLKELLEVADADKDEHLTVDEIYDAREKIVNSEAQYSIHEWLDNLEL